MLRLAAGANLLSQAATGLNTISKTVQAWIRAPVRDSLYLQHQTVLREALERRVSEGEEAIERKITMRWLSPQLKDAGVERGNWAANSSGSRAAGMSISSSV